MADSKPIYMSKVFWVNLIIILIGLLTFLQTFPLGDKTTGGIEMVIGGLGMALRFATGLPIDLTAFLGGKVNPETQADIEKVIDDLEKEAGTKETPPPT
jgi:uncharacterized membrane protein